MLRARWDLFVARFTRWKYVLIALIYGNSDPKDKQ
jgi:hypothetical protein